MASFINSYRFGIVLPKITTCTLIASTTSARSQNITAPSAINAGDLLIYCDHGYQTVSGPIPAVTPTGFTNLFNRLPASGGRRLYYSAKIADGTEDSTSIAGMINSAGTGSQFGIGKAMLQFRCDRAVTDFGALTGNIGVPTSDQTSMNTSGSRTITSGSATVLKPTLIIGAETGIANCTFHLKDSGVNVEDATPIDFNDGSQAALQNKVAWYFRSSLPVDIAADLSAGGSQHWTSGFYMELN